MYEYIEGTDPGPEDMEQAGELVGRLHNCMEEYGGELKVRDKYFFYRPVYRHPQKKEICKGR